MRSNPATGRLPWTRLSAPRLCAALASACTGSVGVDAQAPDGARGDGAATELDASPEAPEPGADGATFPADAGVARDATSLRDATSAVEDALVAAQGSCSGHDYALCEDFESAGAAALPAGWSLLWAPPDASVPHVVVEEHHSGASALETAEGVAGQARVGHALTDIGALAGKHWGRIWYKSEEPLPPPTADVLHNTIVALEGTVESRVVDTVVQPSGQHQFLYNVPDDSVAIGTDYRYKTYDGQWHCAEWFVDADTQTYRFFVDGIEASFVQGVGQRPKLEHFTSIALGFICYRPASKPYRGWLDDLAIDSERIGCD